MFTVLHDYHFAVLGIFAKKKSFYFSWPSAMLRRVNTLEHTFKRKRSTDVAELATYLSGRSQVETMCIYFTLNLLPWAVRARTVDLSLLCSCSCTCKFWDKCKSHHHSAWIEILGEKKSFSVWIEWCIINLTVILFCVCIQETSSWSCNRIFVSFQEWLEEPGTKIRLGLR